MYLCAKIVTKRRNNTMMVFENIPHVERKIFKRTTMNEIALFFTFDANTIPMIATMIEMIGTIKQHVITPRISAMMFPARSPPAPPGV